MLRILTSMRLTVVCLAFALALVFIGTIAQVNEGLYAAQTRYFKSFIIYWSPAGGGFQIPILPGGYTVGAVLLANLVAAHLQRFGLNRKKLGILLIHSGLILLLLGQLFTDLLSQESTMRLVRGGTSNYSEDFFLHELVLIDKTDPNHDQVVAIPQSSLQRKGEIRHSQLPVTIRVKDYWPNAELFDRATNGATRLPVTEGLGKMGVYILPQPPVTTTDSRNVPAAVVELATASGSLGTWVVSGLVSAPQAFEVQNRRFEIAFRIKRHYKPYSITLLDLKHDVYKGTEIPRNFSSRVRIQNPKTAEDREVLIYMNNPLRYQGETYYQYQMEKSSNVSVLQVVRNPSWLTPYLSCVLVGLGLTIQFLTHLIGFAKRRTP